MIIKLNINWIRILYSILKEFLIFIGESFLLFVTFFFTSKINELLVYRFDAATKLSNEIEMQTRAATKVVKGKVISQSYSLSDESQMLNGEISNSNFVLISLIIVIPIISLVVYLMFVQLNIRSKIRSLSLITAFVLVITYFFAIEFDNLILNGDGNMFLYNLIIPLIISMVFCLYILLTPREDNNFEYENNYTF